MIGTMSALEGDRCCEGSLGSDVLMLGKLLSDLQHGIFAKRSAARSLLITKSLPQRVVHVS